MNPHPSIQELAEPLRQPGALPKGIPLSIGIIANAGPAVLAAASREAPSTYFDATVKADPANTAALEQEYPDLHEKLADAGESADDNPHVKAAREEMVDAMVSRANAQLDLPSLESQLRLRTQVEQQVRHLSRAGWLACTAAGVILGTCAALGFTLSYDSPPAAPSATASEQIIVVSSALLGGGIGFGVGARLQGRFARRRARSLMRKAGASL